MRRDRAYLWRSRSDLGSSFRSILYITQKTSVRSLSKTSFRGRQNPQQERQPGEALEMKLLQDGQTHLSATLEVPRCGRKRYHDPLKPGATAMTPLRVQEATRSLLQKQQQQQEGNYNQNQHEPQQLRQDTSDPNACSQETKSGVNHHHRHDVCSDQHDTQEQSPSTSRQHNHHLCPHPAITFTLTNDGDDNQNTKKPLIPGTEEGDNDDGGSRGVGSVREDPVTNEEERELDGKGETGEDRVSGNEVITDEERVSGNRELENGEGKHLNMEEGRDESMNNRKHGEKYKEKSMELDKSGSLEKEEEECEV